MPQPVSSSGSSTSYDPGVDDSNADFVYPGETSLSDVANRLGVSLDSLVKANPQIKDPNNVTPGQEIQRPPTPPPVPMRDSGDSSQVPAKSGLTPRPLGDTIAVSAIRAQLDASMPKTTSTMGSQPTVGTGNVDSTGEGENVSRPDPKTQKLLDAQSKLDGLGLPRTLPTITSEDFDKVTGNPEPQKGPPGDSLKQQTEDAIGLGSLGLGAMAGWGPAAGASAGAATLGGALLAIPGAFFLGASIAERAQSNKQAHDDAITKMEGGMSYAAQQMIHQKFPQIKDHPLNQAGKAQAQATFNDWKKQNDDHMDEVLRVLDGHKGLICDDPVGYAKGSLKDGTIDLSNRLMQVYYNPQNWEK
jgi:hypothetical protein